MEQLVIPTLEAGYANGGASRKKRAFKGFIPKSFSAHEDIDLHNMTLRQRARVLYMAAPVATSAIRTNRTNVIGTGLRLKPSLDYEFLDMSKEDAASMEKHIEAEFALWASDKRACDATGVNDFYAMQQLALISWLMSGDCFVLFKEADDDPLRPYTLRLHIAEADRISTPNPTGAYLTSSLRDGRPLIIPGAIIARKGTATVYDGVEVDKNGTIVAYHIANRPPVIGVEKTRWTRIEAYDPITGLPNILHVMDAERPEQYRGVPYLAHVIEPILQLRRYTESEIMAAVVESFFTAFVTTNTDPMHAQPLGSVADPEDAVTYDPDELEMGPGMINHLMPGEGVTFADPKRPTSGFDTFMVAITRQIGAALEIPSEELLKAFTSSYSASRAALLEAWKAFDMRRTWFVSDFCAPVYAMWFTEAVARERIDAPGFFDNPLIRNAWLGAEWIGPSQGQIDPTKEVQAETMAIAAGLTTREQATMRLNGGNFDANIKQLSVENELLADANSPLVSQPQGFEDTSTSEASGGGESNEEEDQQILERGQ